MVPHLPAHDYGAISQYLGPMGLLHVRNGMLSHYALLVGCPLNGWLLLIISQAYFYPL